MSNIRTKRTARAIAFLVISELVRDYGRGDEEVQHAWRVLCETEEAFHGTRPPAEAEAVAGTFVDGGKPG
jgi:hypothetical protein